MSPALDYRSTQIRSPDPAAFAKSALACLVLGLLAGYLSATVLVLVTLGLATIT